MNQKLSRDHRMALIKIHCLQSSVAIFIFHKFVVNCDHFFCARAAANKAFIWCLQLHANTLLHIVRRSRGAVNMSICVQSYMPQPSATCFGWTWGVHWFSKCVFMPQKPGWEFQASEKLSLKWWKTLHPITSDYIRLHSDYIPITFWLHSSPSDAEMLFFFWSWWAMIYWPRQLLKDFAA